MCLHGPNNCLNPTSFHNGNFVAIVHGYIHECCERRFVTVKILGEGDLGPQDRPRTSAAALLGFFNFFITAQFFGDAYK
jgi:hypothetical protein